MKGTKTPIAARKRRHERVRKTVSGSPERPRLCVFRSLSHVYAQVIDDERGHTLAAASDRETAVESGDKKARAGQVGRLVAERAKAAGVQRVVFDRGGYAYHGRVQALAEAARKAGLEF